MQRLKDAIVSRGRALDGDVLLVDSFLNHQVDAALMRDVGAEFAHYFAGKPFDAVATIESSGIAPAVFTALEMGLPLVILKKQTSRIMTGDRISTTVRSFTKGTEYELTVKTEFLRPGQRVLFIDDFLASGEAAFGMLRLAEKAGAMVGGVGIVIEKAFQTGHDRLVQAGIDVYSLARVKAMGPEGIEFVD